jgi:hypothetical protein
MPKIENKKKFIPDNMPRVYVYALIAWCVGLLGVGICALSVLCKIGWLYKIGFAIGFTAAGIFVSICLVGVAMFFARKKLKPWR